MLGIIVLNYNTYNLTIECIESIKKTYTENHHIYIVDNGSNNESYSILRDIYSSCKNITVLKIEINRGFSYGNNYGTRYAIEDGCKYILLSNNDIIFKPSAIKELYDSISMDSNIILAFPKVFTPTGDLQFEYILKREADFFYELVLRRRLFKLVPKIVLKYYMFKSKDQTQQITTRIFPGCCFIVNGKQYLNLGMLDEEIFLYYEEDILSHRISKHGGMMLYNPKSEIIHIGRGSTNKKNAIWTEYKSKIYYWKKYKKYSNILCKLDLYITYICRIFIYCRTFKDLCEFYRRFKALKEQVYIYLD